MNLDDLLITIIIAGIGVSIAYLRAEFVLHRALKAAARTNELALREAHINRVRPEQNHTPSQPRTHPSSIQADVFPAMKILPRVLRISLQERQFIFLRERARTGARS